MSTKNPIRQFDRHEDFDRVPVLDEGLFEDRTVQSVFRKQNTGAYNIVVLIDNQHEQIVVEPNGNRCSECSHNETTTIPDSVSATTAIEKRAKSSCKHATAAASLPPTGNCECGCWVMEKESTQTDDGTELIRCSLCGRVQ
jgi:hypothetical protein